MALTHSAMIQARSGPHKDQLRPKMQVGKMLQLAKMLDELEETLEAGERFNIMHYWHKGVCGTSACAIGWGILKIPDLGFDPESYSMPRILNDTSHTIGTSAVQQVLGLTFAEALIFFEDNYKCHRGSTTPQMVAAEIRRIVREYQESLNPVKEESLARSQDQTQTEQECRAEPGQTAG